MSVQNKLTDSNHTTERLPFIVTRVRTTEELEKAISIRHTAFSRHVPELGEMLGLPEKADLDPNVSVLLAYSKLDGSPVGSLRLRTNDSAPLTMEKSIELPAHLKGRRLTETVRLSVAAGSKGTLVKHALVKAVLHFAMANEVDYAMVAARAPLDRQYLRMMFEDVFPHGSFIPMKHSNDIPHRVLAFEIASGARRLLAANNPLIGFYYQTHHPDIHVHTFTDRESPVHLKGQQQDSLIAA